MGGLGINFGFLVAQIVNFLILLIVLQKWVYPRVLNMLEQRRERIRSSMEEAEEARRRAALAEEEYQKRVDEARREADSIIRRATEQAEQVRQDILAKANEEARELRQRAEEDIATQRAQALIGMREQVADLAVLAASRVIGRSLGEDGHRQLVQDFLAQEFK